MPAVSEDPVNLKSTEIADLFVKELALDSNNSLVCDFQLAMIQIHVLC